MKEIEFDTNLNYVSVNLTYTTAPRPLCFSIHINFTGERCDNFLVHTKLFIQGDDKDKRYLKEFMRFTIDARKVLNGEMGMSFISQTIMSGLAEAADFELKFPFKKVIVSYPIQKKCFRLQHLFNSSISIAIKH